MNRPIKNELEKEKSKDISIYKSDYNQIRMALIDKISNDLKDYWLKAFKRFWNDFIKHTYFKKLNRDYRTNLFDYYRDFTFWEMTRLMHFEINELVIQILFFEGRGFKKSYNLKDKITIPSWKDKRELIKNLDKIAKDYQNIFMKRLGTLVFLPLLVQLQLVQGKLKSYTIKEIMKIN